MISRPRPSGSPRPKVAGPMSFARRWQAECQHCRRRSAKSSHPQRPQLEIVPEHARLQAELFVPARAIGFIEPGQSVRLLFDAFPYQHFGTYRGKVVRVSQTILMTSDTGGPIKLNDPTYRVIASLERQDIDAHGKKIALQPDMLLRADIVLEWRSLMDWLLGPLRSVRM